MELEILFVKKVDIRENGLMTKETVMVFLNMKMEKSMKENGLKTENKV